MTKILLTGPPGVGKTSVIKKTLEKINRPVGGFYTTEIREQGKRAGFRIVGLNGEEDIMAHVDFPGPRVNKYGVNVLAFDRIGPSALDDALKNGKLIIMDEIGMMELLSEIFQRKVLEILDTNADILGVIKEHSNPFINRIKARKDITIITVTHENRTRLPEEMISVFSG